jgi:hypothetical protein
VNATMANYSPLTKILMDDPKPKSKSPFHSSSWIHQAKDVKKETPKEHTINSNGLLLKSINNYEIKCFYKINKEDYYKNVPIYRENRNKYIPKTKK